MSGAKIGRLLKLTEFSVRYHLGRLRQNVVDALLGYAAMQRPRSMDLVT